MMPDQRPVACPVLHYSAYSNWSLATYPCFNSSLGFTNLDRFSGPASSGSPLGRCTGRSLEYSGSSQHTGGRGPTTTGYTRQYLRNNNRIIVNYSGSSRHTGGHGQTTTGYTRQYLRNNNRIIVNYSDNFQHTANCYATNTW